MNRRDIRPEEMDAIVRLAAKYPDLRTIESELAELPELRKRVAELAQGSFDPVQPKSVSDLLKLEKAGYIKREQVAERLGISPDDTRTDWWRDGKRIRWKDGKPEIAN